MNKIEYEDGILSLFLVGKIWNLCISFSFGRWLFGEPIMQVFHFAYRSPGHFSARCLNAELNLLRFFVLVSIGKVGMPA